MTTSPQEPLEQEDPQTHVHGEPDRIPSTEETLDAGGGNGDEPDLRPDIAPDETEQDMPGVDPDWPQEPAEQDDPELPG